MQTKDFTGIRNNGPLPTHLGMKIPPDIGNLLEDYIDSANSQLDELERAALAYESGNSREENAAVIRRILHKIKGESGMVGIDDISELCHQAEFAFEELGENQRADMLLRLKDWICDAICSMASKE